MGSSDDGERRLGGNDAGKMSRAACAGDDDLHTATFEHSRVYSLVRAGGQMRGGDVDFIRNGKLGQRLRGLVHDVRGRSRCP